METFLIIAIGVLALWVWYRVHYLAKTTSRTVRYHTDTLDILSDFILAHDSAIKELRTDLKDVDTDVSDAKSLIVDVFLLSDQVEDLSNQIADVDYRLQDLESAEQLYTDHVPTASITGNG
jgi:hypothetical protein